MAYLVLGELESDTAALQVIRGLADAGFSALDLHSPYPVEGAAVALGLRPSRVRVAALVLGLAGAVAGYALQWFANARDYPINVGDRPPHAVPAFIPLAFEGLVLAAALGIVATLLLGRRLPHLHHPALAVDAFRSATGGGFWVTVGVEGDIERDRARDRLRALGARDVTFVATEAGR